MIPVLERFEGRLSSSLEWHTRVCMQHQAQQTFARSISFQGRGLHTGRKCRITLHPAEPDTGILFVRSDRDDAEVPASIRYAVKKVRCSGLEKDGVLIRTPEHLLAAMFACSIDNAVVEMTREEVPIFDSSAQPLIEELDRAGIQVQEHPRTYLRVEKRIESRDGERFVRLEPAEESSIDLSLTLRRFGTISHGGLLTPDSFRADIARARTFAPMRHALPMKLAALLTGIPIARGLTLSNTLLYARGRVWNPGGLRYDNEMARHRVLDLTGDLMLLGGPVIGKITVFRSSHSLNQDLARMVWEDPEAVTPVTMPMERTP